jgi:hypothetical protein
MGSAAKNSLQNYLYSPNSVEIGANNHLKQLHAKATQFPNCSQKSPWIIKTPTNITHDGIYQKQLNSSSFIPALSNDPP